MIWHDPSAGRLARIYAWAASVSITGTFVCWEASIARSDSITTAIVVAACTLAVIVAVCALSLGLLAAAVHAVIAAVRVDHPRAALQALTLAIANGATLAAVMYFIDIIGR